MPIIYRSVKGSELTSNEVDGNFEFLDEEKQDNLTFDSTPTAASSNPVTSDGIYQAIQDVEEAAGITDTGVLTYAGASAASANQINIGAATGWIVDNETTPGTPVKTFVNYAGESNKTVTTVGTGLASYVLLDSTGTIVFQNTFPTSEERKTMLYLSKVGHPAGTINIVGNEPDFILSPISQLRDLTKYIGFINLDVRPSANGANLNINTSAGTVYRHNGNFVTSDTVPNEITVASQVAASFLYRTQTGAGGGFVTAIDPTTYDLAGTSTAIPGSTNQATNQRIYLVPGLGYIIQQGQTIYATLTDAIAAVTTESFVVYPSLINNAILIGILSVQKGATTLNNTAQARFFVTDKFGQVSGATAGVSTATQQIAYNNSSVPQIVVTDALGSETFRNGRALDTSNVVEIQNIAGSTTASINGNGVITSTAHIVNGTAGAGYLQLLNQSAPPSAVNNNMTLYSDSSNRFSMVRRNNANSADITRTLIFNDATVSYTFPNQNTDTLAGLGSAQTFTAQQTFSGSSTQLASISLLDTTYKTALDVSSANTLRIGNGFTTLTTPVTSFIYTGASTSIQISASNGGVGFTRAGNITSTSGNFKAVTIQQTFAPTGTTPPATFRVFDTSSVTINQATAGSTGDITLFNIAPTVTSVIAQLYGLRSQIANSPTGGGTAYNIYADGTAPNRFAGIVQLDTSLALLDTTYKTALDVSAANTLRLGNGFANVTIPTTNINLSGSATSISQTESLTFNRGNISGAHTGYLYQFFNGTYSATSGILEVIKPHSSVNVTSGTPTIGFVSVAPSITNLNTGASLYGIWSQISASPTGGGSTWNIFSSGTAPNRFVGNIESGTIQLLDTTYKTALDVNAATSLRIGNGFSILSVGTPTIRSFGGTLAIQTGGSSSANTYLDLTSNGFNTFTSGSGVLVKVSSGYLVSSGTGSLTALNITTTLNESGTASGTHALFDVNPTLTSVRGTAYGVRSRLADTPTGGGTTYNIFADGTAPNYFGAPVQFPSYTVAQANALTTLQGKREGAFIYVNNESGGKTMAFYDGTNWCRVQDRATIS